ncbi:hypothetical protein NQZ68_000291 [Dissostichus eleginoides]|nr:hypothetical protein NQZ68_000291 [Dissostichus eleginoides]
MADRSVDVSALPKEARDQLAELDLELSEGKAGGGGCLPGEGSTSQLSRGYEVMSASSQEPAYLAVIPRRLSSTLPIVQRRVIDFLKLRLMWCRALFYKVEAQSALMLPPPMYRQAISTGRRAM